MADNDKSERESQDDVVPRSRPRDVSVPTETIRYGWIHRDAIRSILCAADIGRYHLLRLEAVQAEPHQDEVDHSDDCNLRQFDHCIFILRQVDSDASTRFMTPGPCLGSSCPRPRSRIGFGN